jgi:hypothetical protein
VGQSGVVAVAGLLVADGEGRLLADVVPDGLADVPGGLADVPGGLADVPGGLADVLTVTCGDLSEPKVHPATSAASSVSAAAPVLPIGSG